MTGNSLTFCLLSDDALQHNHLKLKVMKSTLPVNAINLSYT